LVEIESKDEMRQRGVKSPDRAEALMLGSRRNWRMARPWQFDGATCG